MFYRLEELKKPNRFCRDVEKTPSRECFAAKLVDLHAILARCNKNAVINNTFAENGLQSVLC